MTQERPSQHWAESHPGALGLALLACVVVVGVGIKLAAPFLVPFVMAVVVTTISAPLAGWLRKGGAPRPLAIGMAVLAAAAVLIGLGALVVLSANQLAENLPEYARLVGEVSERATDWLRRLSPGLRPPDLVDSAAVTAVVASLVGNTVGFVWNAVLALIIAAFLLFEVVGHDVTAAVPRETPLRRAMAEVNKYIAIKSAMSAGTGLLVAAWIWLLDGELPILFGLLAFLLNYIPNVGSILAATPAVALALLQGGPSNAATIATGYVVVNVVIGNVVEPRVMGRALGLSPLVVLLSVIVWGVLLGPVGALLSALLTVFVKLALSSTDDLRHLAAYLGPVRRPPLGQSEADDLVEVVVPQTSQPDQERGASDA